MIYDVIYFYNQFIAPLPPTYDEFVKSWNSMFHTTYDTKVISFNSQYFGQTILGKIFDKCTKDKKLKDILKFRFDLENGFVNYEGSDLLAHYHEAAYDAYMTGYVFAKILKYKEIDEIYQRKKLEKSKQKNHRKNQKKQENEEEEKEFKQILPEPKDIENTPVNFNY